jgi:TATA-binding protein-associated factor Taf7
MEKSNRTIKAIYSYMDIVSNWLDDTDGKLKKIDSTSDQLRHVSGSPFSFSGDHSVDGTPKKEPEDEVKEDEQAEEKTGEESEDTEQPERLSADEKEELRDTIEQMKDDIKVCGRNLFTYICIIYH